MEQGRFGIHNLVDVWSRTGYAAAVAEFYRALREADPGMQLKVQLYRFPGGRNPADLSVVEPEIIGRGAEAYEVNPATMGGNIWTHAPQRQATIYHERFPDNIKALVTHDGGRNPRVMNYYQQNFQGELLRVFNIFGMPRDENEDKKREFRITKGYIQAEDLKTRLNDILGINSA